MVGREVGGEEGGGAVLLVVGIAVVVDVDVDVDVGVVVVVVVVVVVAVVVGVVVAVGVGVDVGGGGVLLLLLFLLLMVVVTVVVVVVVAAAVVAEVWLLLLLLLAVVAFAAALGGAIPLLACAETRVLALCSPGLNFASAFASVFAVFYTGCTVQKRVDLCISHRFFRCFPVCVAFCIGKTIFSPTLDFLHMQAWTCISL